jgi:hypothetical protein
MKVSVRTQDMHTVDAPPKASVLIESMRDIGYSLESALADVLDNSITASANTIHVHVDTSSADIRIGVVDDGKGMTREELLDAMRLGSRHPRDVRTARDLGRFGLGLKTASFSQCRRLTVVARKDGRTSVAIWDLDHVAKEDKWSLIVPVDPEAVPFIESLGSEGALVVWEHLDRAIEDNASEVARKHFVRRMNEVTEHLELVFHRYLAGEKALRKVAILVNGVPLVPFDPFHRRHSATQHGPLELIKLPQGTVEIQRYTLPHHRNVTPAEWDRYAGPAGYLKNQGFYLYREKRLIIYGTWFGLARQMEITKLTRVRIDMPNSLDAEWQVDVKKASARPPLQVRERLQHLLAELGAPSRTIYLKRGAKLHDSPASLWQRLRDNNTTVYRLDASHPGISGFAVKLPADLRSEFTRLIQSIGAALPMDSIFADLAGSPESVRNDLLPEEALRELLQTTYAKLVAVGVTTDVIPHMLRNAEPFRSDWDRAEKLLAGLESEGAL